MANSTRPYDIVLFGATGYTGKLTAFYIAKHAPTDIKWAIAGRSASKLEAVSATCNSLNPDRIQPAIEACNLDDAELGDLARQTRVLISSVGPFSAYGEYAFKACAENGTHYIDCTGESPWVLKMIRKYEKTAKSTGAIMIPQIGVESGPPDLLTWSLVSLIRQKMSAPTANVILSVHELRSSISGGTAATALSMVDHVTSEELSASQKPFGLSPIPPPKSKSSASWLTMLFGVRTVPHLGLLSTSIQAFSDVPIVMRSWGVLGGSRFYGPKFFYEQCHRVNSYFQGVALHLVATIGTVVLLIRPIRWLLKKLVYAPGDGPTEEQKKGNKVEWRAIANADVANTNPPKAYGRANYIGSMYNLTALIMVEAALTILKDDVVATKSGGGILTPATLGQTLIDRLDRAGLKFEAKMLES